MACRDWEKSHSDTWERKLDSQQFSLHIGHQVLECECVCVRAAWPGNWQLVTRQGVCVCVGGGIQEGNLHWEAIFMNSSTMWRDRVFIEKENAMGRFSAMIKNISFSTGLSIQDTVLLTMILRDFISSLTKKMNNFSSD